MQCLSILRYCVSQGSDVVWDSRS